MNLPQGSPWWGDLGNPTHNLKINQIPPPTKSKKFTGGDLSQHKDTAKLCVLLTTITVLLKPMYVKVVSSLYSWVLIQPTYQNKHISCYRESTHYMLPHSALGEMGRGELPIIWKPSSDTLVELYLLAVLKLHAHFHIYRKQGHQLDL